MLSSLFDLSNRVAVVTGAMGLLGQQFCTVLAQHGATVAAVDLVSTPRAPLPIFLQLVEENKIYPFKCDITKKLELSSILSAIIKATKRVPSILVNNAGIDSPPNSPLDENGPFENYPEDSLSEIVNVNLIAPILCCQVFGGEMAKTSGGSIINIASIYGMLSPQQDIYEYKTQNGQQWFKPVAYSVSKSGIFNLTRYLATYWAKKNVRVNTLTPAGIENSQDEKFLTEYLKRMPMGRMARKDELNGALVFLASHASSYMTGANLVIDGGWTAW